MLYDLDRLFAALADPTRRVLLRRLAHGPAFVGQLAALCPTISLAAVSKHLHLLRRAGLVKATRQGQFYRFELLPDALRHTDDWLAAYRTLAARPKVALLGTSANPPHAGHLAVSHALLALGYTEVWWSIAPEQEFKPKASLAPYAHRVALAHILLKREPHIKLDMTEAGLTIADEHYRAHTWLSHMAAAHPGTDFTFVMGADSWGHQQKGFGLWGGAAEILNHAAVLVMPRPDLIADPAAALAAQRLKAAFYTGPGVVPRGHWGLYPVAVREISSTTLRQQLASGQAPDGLTAEQLDYIEAHGLYGAHADQ